MLLVKKGLPGIYLVRNFVVESRKRRGRGDSEEEK